MLRSKSWATADRRCIDGIVPADRSPLRFYPNGTGQRKLLGECDARTGICSTEPQSEPVRVTITLQPPPCSRKPADRTEPA